VLLGAIVVLFIARHVLIAVLVPRKTSAPPHAALAGEALTGLLTATTVLAAEPRSSPAPLAVPSTPAVVLQPILPEPALAVQAASVAPAQPALPAELPALSSPLRVAEDSSEGGWMPPPSQARAPPGNARNVPRPPPKKYPENFLRARPHWEKGQPKLSAPYPDEYVPALTAKKRPLRSREPFSLPPRLWSAPDHQPDNDAILALAVNYRIVDYVRFVGTLRRTGYSGDVVLAVSSKMDLRTRKFLQSMDVIAYPVQFNCSSGTTAKHANECDWHAKQDMPLPLAVIRHELYLAWAWKYNERSRLLILDFRDTFFQRDPFESLSLGRQEPYFQQLVVLEHWPYKRMSNCPFNKGWVQGCWGRDKFSPMSNHPILCSGSYFATRNGMIDLEAELLSEVRKVKCHKKGVPSDQGYVNYLYWAGRLPYATHEIRGEGIVNTVGALMGKNHRGSVGPLSTHWRIVCADGHVVDNDNKTWSAVVHQWDRFFDELYWTVDAVLECRNCYTSKSGHPRYDCQCLKFGCSCSESPQA